jgi:hypothetical protein
VLDLLGEGGYDEVRIGILSYAEYKYELCAVTRLTKDNKEE